MHAGRQPGNLKKINKVSKYKYPTVVQRVEHCDKYTMAQIKASPVYHNSTAHNKAKLTKRELCTLLQRPYLPIQHPEDLQKTHQKLANRVQSKFGGAKALAIVPPGWTFTELLGRGRLGEVYLIKRGMEQNAIKYQHVDRDSVLYEILMQQKFAAKGLSPNLYAFHLWGSAPRPYSSIRMEKIDMLLSTFLKTPRLPETLNTICFGLLSLIDRMCAFKIRHNDFHWENVGLIVRLVGHRLKLVTTVFDFGFASVGHRQCYNAVDLFQLVRTLHAQFKPDMDPKNIEYMQSYFFAAFTRAVKKQGGTLNSTLSVQDLVATSMFHEFVGQYRPSPEQKHQYVQKHLHTLDSIQLA